MRDEENQAPGVAPDPGNSPPEDWCESLTAEEEEFVRRYLATHPLRFTADDRRIPSGGEQ